MTVQPILPALVLAAMVAAFIGARVVVLPRSPGSAATTWRWGALTAAGVLLFVAALRPALGDGRPTPQVAGDHAPNVFLVIDRSPTMSVSDSGVGTRMAAARADTEALMDRYPEARFAVIGFAARPALVWPLSADTWSLGPVLDAVAPQPVTPESVALTNAGAAGTVLRYQLISAMQQYPRGRNLVFYLGAGAAGSEVRQREFDLPDRSVDGGAVLGYGTTAPRSLQQVADQIGVPYRHRAGDTPLDQGLPPAGAGDQSDTAQTSVVRTELYWIPAGMAALLILAELYLVLRPLRRQLGVWL